jgi:hypothetical protein
MDSTGLESRLDIAALARGLEGAGWDVIASPETGEVAARLEHPPIPGVWTLVIDHSGRVRFTAVRKSGVANGRLLWRDQRQFRLLKESQQVLSVASDLRAEGELTELLGELATLALTEIGAGREEEDPWKQLPGERGTASDLSVARGRERRAGAS